MSGHLPDELEDSIELYESGDTEAAKAAWRRLLPRGGELASLATECIALVEEAGDDAIDLRKKLMEDDDLGWGELLDNVGELSGFGVVEADLDSIPGFDESESEFDELVVTNESADEPEHEDPLARLSLLDELPPEASSPGSEDDLFSEHPMVDDQGEPVDNLFADLTHDDLAPGRDGGVDDFFAEHPDQAEQSDALSQSLLDNAEAPHDGEYDTAEFDLRDPLADPALGDLGAQTQFDHPDMARSNESSGPGDALHDPLGEFEQNAQATGKREMDNTTPAPNGEKRHNDPLAHFFDDDEPLIPNEEDRNNATNPDLPSRRAPVDGLGRLLGAPDADQDDDVTPSPPPLSEPAPRQTAPTPDRFFDSSFDIEEEESRMDTVAPLMDEPRARVEPPIRRPNTPSSLDLLPPPDDEEDDLLPPPEADDEEDDREALDALQKLFDEASSLVDSAPMDERVRPMPGEVSRPSTPQGTPRAVDLQRSRMGETDSPTPSAPIPREFSRQPTPMRSATSDFVRTQTGDLPNADSYAECQDLVRAGDVFKAWARATELQRDNDSEGLAEFTAALHERLLGMAVELVKPLERTPSLAVSLSEVTQLPGLDHRAGYLLSQIDGTVPIEFLIDLGAMPREEAALLLLMLEDRGVIRM